jgi:hypothetical protein
MAKASRAIGGRIAGQLVGIAMQPPQPLPQILAARHQIGPVKPEPGPIFQHPQTFASPVEIGVDQALDPGLAVGKGCRGRIVARNWI